MTQNFTLQEHRSISKTMKMKSVNLDRKLRSIQESTTQIKVTNTRIDDLFSTVGELKHSPSYANQGGINCLLYRIMIMKIAVNIKDRTFIKFAI